MTLRLLLCVAWIAAATAQAAGTDTVDASPSLFVLAAEVTPSPTVGAASVDISVGSGTPDATGTVSIPVTLASGGAAVAGTQNDILFDNSVLQLDAADCSLNPALSDHPPGADPCTPSHVVAPCKQLVRSVVPCGADPQPLGCPDDAGSQVSVFHGLVFASMSALNLNPIPDGVVYTCTFTVLSPSRLPTTLANRRAMASDAFGGNLSVTAADGQVFPIPPTATSTPTQTPTATLTFRPTATATATPTPTPLSGAPGDGNCDGVISAADLPAVIEALGSSILPCTGLDADQDGKITAADLSLAVQEIFAEVGEAAQRAYHNYGAPSHAPRGTTVEVERVQRIAPQAPGR